MSKSNIPLLTLTIIASAALAADRVVTLAGAYPAAGGLGFGVTRSEAEIGDATPADVLGTAIATAGAAFAADVPLMVGTDGKLIAHDGDGDKHAFARSMEAATADGDSVEVLLIPIAGVLVTAA